MRPGANPADYPGDPLATILNYTAAWLDTIHIEATWNTSSIVDVDAHWIIYVNGNIVARTTALNYTFTTPIANVVPHIAVIAIPANLDDGIYDPLFSDPTAANIIVVKPISTKSYPPKADQFGNVWVYDPVTDSWIETGIQLLTSIVSDCQNGLISPQIYNLINQIKQYQNSGVSFQYNKIGVGVPFGKGQPYFYYFFSSDKSISFKAYKQSNRTNLNIEANRNALLAKLSSQSCAGGIGPQGQKGQQGFAGIPAGPEKTCSFYNITKKSVYVKARVDTPIDTPISLRAFNNTTKIFEMLFSVSFSSGSEGIIIIDGLAGYTIDRQKTNITFIPVNNLYGEINGDIFLTAGNFTSASPLYFKVRQVGPKGSTGPDGSNFLALLNQVPSDTITFNQYIGTLYESLGDLSFVKSPVVSANITSSSLSLSPLALGNYVVSVEESINDIRRLCYFAVAANITIPPLVVPTWVPSKACVQPGASDEIKSAAYFDWFKDTSVDFLIHDFEDGSGTVGVDCLENFFLCTNLGDCCSITPPPPIYHGGLASYD